MKNKGNKINKKRKISKKRRKEIRRARLILATICLILIIIVVKLKNITFSDDDSPKVLVSENSKQKDKENNISKMDMIVQNSGEYPESLIELARKYEETIDFVLNYPKNKDKDYKINPNDFKKEKNGIQLFIQWDEHWGYKKYGDDFMALTGCAPTALAMVIYSLNNDKSVTPNVIAKYAEENNFYVDGIGSSWELVNAATKKYGLKSTAIPLNENTIISSLENGNPIITSVGPGTFTGSGHFLVLTGITDEGKIKINDPNSKINSSKEWDIDVFIKESLMLWEISK
ncbi:C39 family peptidase [Clostridium gasigenes]|uniref:Peptidase_C39 like family protein n=1 Tax=Clostridium gasigenes TaxID=94869 RepID=A0A1H0VW19_9CLOT|nr:C39 family peptidase [Clostridium gasigenes]SDP82747.1 Peptidase_C39 like family protein [Clostridium gasigenes]